MADMRNLLPFMISGVKTLLLLMFAFGVTLLVPPQVSGVWVVVVFVVVFVVCSLFAIPGPSLVHIARSVAMSRRLWWRVLGLLSFFLDCLGLLRYARDGDDALKYLTLTCGIAIDVLLLHLYTAEILRGGAAEGASSRRGVLVAVAVFYRATVLISPPPLCVAAAFAAMVGICVRSIFSEWASTI